MALKIKREREYEREREREREIERERERERESICVTNINCYANRMPCASSSRSCVHIDARQSGGSSDKVQV
jgi:hypothetical protein